MHLNTKNYRRDTKYFSYSAKDGFFSAVACKRNTKCE